MCGGGAKVLMINRNKLHATSGICALLYRIFRNISRRRRWQLVALLFLMILSAFAEMLSIGAVIPFLTVLTAPEMLMANPIATRLLSKLALTTTEQIMLVLTVAFAIAAFIAGGMRLGLLWMSVKLSNAIGGDLSIDMYRRTLYQPYDVHISRNSSDIISGISSKANTIVGVITMAVTLISSVIMLSAVLGGVLLVAPFIAIIAFGCVGLIYGLLIRLTRKKLIHDSEHIAKESTQVIKCLQEGLGGIRDILLDGNQAAYCDIYAAADTKLRKAQTSSAFIGSSPRYVLEAIGMAIIAGFAYSIAGGSGGIGVAIPVLGAIAMGAQRLLPVLQQAYAAWSSIRGSQYSLSDALILVEQPMPAYINKQSREGLKFIHKIKLNNISYRYRDNSRAVLKDINFTIEKGSRVGLMGATGSGKSTLLDVIMGLLQPTSGEIIVDDQTIAIQNQGAWQSCIAHVPQSIFLSDNTIAENIAFGCTVDQIDYDRVKEVARQAQVAVSIESLPQKYETKVGERGVRLSGGQRQRIGIARALYKQANVIIFDEATSALDNDTEAAVMDAISKLDKTLTIIVVAHRLSTLRVCDVVIELESGSIVRSGSYADVILSSHLNN